MRKVLDTPAATEGLPRTRGDYAALPANAVGHRGRAQFDHCVSAADRAAADDQEHRRHGRVARGRARERRRGPTVARRVCAERRRATFASLARVSAACGSIVSARANQMRGSL